MDQNLKMAGIKSGWAYAETIPHAYNELQADLPRAAITWARKSTAHTRRLQPCEGSGAAKATCTTKPPAHSVRQTEATSVSSAV
jgi:hypothetical protein